MTAGNAMRAWEATPAERAEMLAQAQAAEAAFPPPSDEELALAGAIFPPLITRIRKQEARQQVSEGKRIPAA